MTGFQWENNRAAPLGTCPLAKARGYCPNRFYDGRRGISMKGSKTEHVDFQAGGELRLTHSVGDILVTSKTDGL
jgi:hypothetical protein